MKKTIMDCTLRDGANIVGAGFPADLTKMILEGLTENNIPVIEMGNTKGLGAYEISNSIAPLNDEEYLELAQPFFSKSKVGMFLNAKRFAAKNVETAAKSGLGFLRIGADAGDHEIATDAILCAKENGFEVFYALMKTYLCTPEELAEEVVWLSSNGVSTVTLMDSAGTMFPEESFRYVATAKRAAPNIQVGFHSHNNLYYAVANGISAVEAGANLIDGGLLGMARSAGNIATEAGIACLEKKGYSTGVNLLGLLNFLDSRLIPSMEKYGYRTMLHPLDLILGYAGCHSSFVPLFREVAKETGADLYELIIKVSKINRKAPSKMLMFEIAEQITA